MKNHSLLAGENICENNLYLKLLRRHEKIILIFITYCKTDRQLLHDEVMKYEIGSGKLITSIPFFFCFDISLPLSNFMCNFSVIFYEILGCPSGMRVGIKITFRAKSA